MRGFAVMKNRHRQMGKGPRTERETVTIGLGGTIEFVDIDHGSRPSPRGLLPTPGEVEKLLRSQAKRVSAMTPRIRQRYRDDLSLSYYFGGQEVAFRFADQGMEVLAVGEEEIQALKDRLSPCELLGVVQEQARAWPE
jgi:hypothetical protein